MAKSRKEEPQSSSEVSEKPAPRCLVVAAEGIKTSEDFANMMSALMSDLVDGRVSPQVGNATCNAGGKLLRIVELQYKYGDTSGGKPKKTLALATGAAAGE